MTARRVRFTATASQHIVQERAWWLANRDHQELFASEIESAVRIVTLLPGTGAPYLRSSTTGLRRIYVRKLGCHLYYTFDDEDVIARAFWGAKRERGPSL